MLLLPSLYVCTYAIVPLKLLYQFRVLSFNQKSRLIDPTHRYNNGDEVKSGTSLIDLLCSIVV